jgi:uncharacterized membrane protein
LDAAISRSGNSFRIFAALAGVLAVGTLVGLVVLWPGEVESGVAEGIAKGSEVASVERVEDFRCSEFQNARCRNVTVELETGSDRGRRTTIQLGTGGVDPDLVPGDRVRVTKGEAAPGVEPVYSLTDFERRRPLLFLALVFAALVIALGRLRGALSLVGLAISLALILVFVVPAILDGKDPLAVALVGSLAVMLTTITLAHGLGAKSLAAMLGTAASLLLTVALASLFTDLTHLTGLASEETAFLQTNDSGVGLEGLLVAGMVIGALGVLDDVTISQASTVLALRRANPSLRFAELFGLATRVGRDHVSATVNTLVLAYVGASLPLLLIFSSGSLGFDDAVNLEIVAKEIVAMLVGSIGLIVAVPITTALSALLALRAEPDELVGVEAAHSH